jgi:VanZ like family
MAALFWTSGRTSLARDLPIPKGPWGNLTHVVTWAALATLLAKSFDGRARRAGLRETAGRAALAVAAAYGLVDEIHQFFTPGRTCSLADVFLDGLGALGALLLPRLGSGARAWAPAAACFLGAAGLAVATGVIRLGPDRLLESTLVALGFSRP